MTPKIVKIGDWPHLAEDGTPTDYGGPTVRITPLEPGEALRSLTAADFLPDRLAAALAKLRL